MPDIIHVPYSPDETTFEQDIVIDKYNLDVECEQQSIKYEKWSRKWAIANARMEQLKAQRDLVEAQLDSEVRSAPESFGITGRVTEQAIKVAVRQSTAWLAANDDLNDAKLLADVLAGAKWSMEQRKEMITNLVRLHGSSYFARPIITTQVVEEAPTQRTLRQVEHLQEARRTRRPIAITA
jgi:hypothetical protein